MPTANSAGGGNPSAAASYLKNPESSEVLWGAVSSYRRCRLDRRDVRRSGSRAAASGILSIYLENIIMEKSGSSGRRVHSDQGREVRRAARCADRAPRRAFRQHWRERHPPRTSPPTSSAASSP